VVSAPEVWQREPHVLWRRSGHLVLLKRPESDDITTLDEAGSALWAQLSQPSTLEVMAARLGELYGIRAAQIAHDITPVLDDLERRHLVHRQAG
jgi:Coenzyme PQQ synthesis protein D (PqqD)